MRGAALLYRNKVAGLLPRLREFASLSDLRHTYEVNGKLDSGCRCDCTSVDG